jgi:hypothetical protein
MGKKSKRRSSGNTDSNSKQLDSNTQPLLPVTAQAEYRSDGPSEEDLACLQTDSPTLQQKLDMLSLLAEANDREQFVRQIVPLDLTDSEINLFLSDLTVASEAEGQWKNLSEEIVALARGKGVTKIEGDQTTKAIFFFEHPILKGCDREVVFICTQGEWRAEG